MMGKIEGKRRKGQRMRWLASITKLNEHEFEQTVGDSGGHAVVHEITKSWTQRRLSTEELMLSNCGAGEDS